MLFGLLKHKYFIFFNERLVFEKTFLPGNV